MSVPAAPHTSVAATVIHAQIFGRVFIYYSGGGVNTVFVYLFFMYSASFLSVSFSLESPINEYVSPSFLIPIDISGLSGFTFTYLISVPLPQLIVAWLSMVFSTFVNTPSNLFSSQAVTASSSVSIFGFVASGGFASEGNQLHIHPRVCFHQSSAHEGVPGAVGAGLRGVPAAFGGVLCGVVRGLGMFALLSFHAKGAGRGVRVSGFRS